MTTINVQFADSTEAVIIGYYGNPQDSSAFPNMGTVDTSDDRWKAYYDTQGPFSQPFLPEPD